MSDHPGHHHNPMLRALLLALALPVLAACGSKDSVYTGHFHAFGGRIDVTIVSLPIDEARRAVAALEEDFSIMEASWNPYSDSPLARANRKLASGESFAAPPCVLPLIEHGRELADLSSGLINVTNGGLTQLWGFDNRDMQGFRPPEPDAITAQLAAAPTIDDIKQDRFLLSSANAATYQDFSPFIKGYALDQAALHLRELGVRNAMINAGGDLYVTGSRAGHPWHVTIRRPNGTGVLATLDITGSDSVVTVGTFADYRTWKGTHYHNILDPRTGWPAQGVRAVTVIHPEATLAHAAATALFIAGPEDWPRIASSMGVEEVLLTDSEGVLHLTPQAQSRLQFLVPPGRLRVVDLESSNHTNT